VIPPLPLGAAKQAVAQALLTKLGRAPEMSGDLVGSDYDFERGGGFNDEAA
jgi:hypothetical protein